MNNLQFEWNEEKAKANLKKHIVGFDEGATTFNDPLIVTIPDPAHSNTEQRYVSLGISIKGRLLAIVHAERNDKIRLISCRKATPRERKPMTNSTSKTPTEDDMLPEYDFSKGERGRFYKPLSKGYSITITHPDGTTTTEHYKLIDGAVLLDPDVRAYFPDSESVNTALRSLIKMMADIPARGKRYVQRPQSAHRVSEK